MCVCGTSIGVSATPRSSSRVTLLWLWLPSIIEGVWGIHFLLRLSLSPCVHIQYYSSFDLLILTVANRRKAYLLLQRRVVWNGKNSTNPFPVYFFPFFLRPEGEEENGSIIMLGISVWHKIIWAWPAAKCSCHARGIIYSCSKDASFVIFRVFLFFCVMKFNYLDNLYTSYHKL